MPNGQVWRNIVTEDKSKPAETLAEFRGNYKYNLLDKNVLAFNAEIPMFAQWDDHEVTNNWWPGEPLTRAEHQRKKYVEKNALLLSARAAQAFHEYMPMRTRKASRVVSTARSLTVHCSMCSCWTCAATVVPTARARRQLRARRLFSRSNPGRLAQAGAGEFARNLEVIAADMLISLLVV